MTCVAGCSTIGTLVERASKILNDREFVSWTKADLIDYYNAALCEVHGLRADAFADTVTLTLKPGGEQELPPEYSAIDRLVANVTTTPDGLLVEGPPLSEADSKLISAFRKKPCLAGSDPCDPINGRKPYYVKTFTRDLMDETTFNVQPPVPPGQTASVRAVVIRRPTRHTPSAFKACSGIECAFEGALTDYVLMRALETDIESQGSVAAADRHRKNFYDTVNLQYLMAQRRGSGYYLGANQELPAGDKDFRQR